MPKKTKTGKGRLDKYYHLAKDQGYRARSAFKLIQLAKKFDFLTKSKVCIDLCGAPGGWSQVAQKNMPMGSQILCVDLVPIKPIHGVTCITSDITTSKCRDLIRKEMKGHKADVVLNDGAPNVGTSWAKDAFSQNELTLSAFKVACEHLRYGGTFVTKVFRSSDYNSLLWVFGQLFEKVEATKPSASRAVSAEIFVLCTNFKAPSKIDPKFFDSKFVFMETMDCEDDEKKNDLSLADLLKTKTKKKRTLTTEDEAVQILDAFEFITAENPAVLLTTNQKMVFESDEAKELLKNPLTTPDILEYSEDLKLLGKSDLTQLVKWRFKLKREHHKKTKEEKKAGKAGKEEKKKDEDEDDEEEQGQDVDEELAEVLKSRRAEEKAARKKKERLAKKQEWRRKMSLNGVFTAQDEMDLFQKNKKNIQALKDESKYITPVVDDMMVDPKDPVTPDSDDSESEDEETLDRLARMEVDIAVQLDMRKNEDESRNKERRKKKAIKETRRQRTTAQWAEEMEGFSAQIDEKAAEEHARKTREEIDDDEEEEAGSDGSDDDNDDDVQISGHDNEGEDAEAEALQEPKSKKRKKGGPEVPQEDTWRADKRADRWFSQDLFSGVQDDFDPETDVHKDDDVPEELSDTDLPQMPLSDKQKKAKKRKKQQERLKAQGIVPDGQKEALEICAAPEITPLDETPGVTANGPQKPEDPRELAETLALGSLMIQKKTRMDLIDSAFNRWTFDGMDSAPNWFQDEENKFNKPELPVSKELMQQFREKLREINARPIRKVAEAQGRKRKRLQHRIDKLRKTAQMLMETPDMSEGAKANQMKKLVSKAKRQDEKKISYVALKKGGGGKQVDKSSAPKGAKVKVVDKRLKSDARAKKRAAKKMDKHGRSKMSKKTEKRAKKRRGKNK